ncbi:MAG TPA: carboxymuconolactone decarboxylase family protein [Solirubrobacteraceae bacterium]|jgi:AhpD family alkylhydroperoxidase|nr:carboxymuconolactone decarboxylase family protein [Solirubrobacteraceae bacterium]
MTTAEPDAGREPSDEAPRIAPGTAADVGRVNYMLARAIGAAGGGGPPHLFTTLARHRRLFRRWLGFAGALMPGGLLPRADTELVILRVAHDTGCEYEWRHHERLALTAGLSAEEVQRVREGNEAPGWSGRQQLLLRAADELHAERSISSALWSELRELMSDAELIELCLLIGHYEMLAMTLKSLRIEPDSLPDEPPRLSRALQLVVARRQRKRRE